MCTLVTLLRPGHPWPVLVGANRDEMAARPARPPARHWADRPEVTAGLDLGAQGSWLGVNDHGVIAAMMNRAGTLGPQAGKRSRGELVLEALDHGEADGAAGALADIDPAAYRPFNLLIADPLRAYWLRLDGEGPVAVYPIAPGLHLIAAGEMDDTADPRIAANQPRFAAAAAPDPGSGDWASWRSLLADPGYPEALGPESAMVQDREDGFGTRSSALIALPAYPGFGARPLWLHAEGRPDQADYTPVDL